MFIETIDLLRCPKEHEETWLVAAFTRMKGRFVIDGTLGCPVCNASFPIEKGIADFRSVRAQRDEHATMPDDSSEAMHVAAFLNLLRPGATVVLDGSHAAHAIAVANMTQCRVIALNPSIDVAENELTSTILSDSRIPLATASVDGIAAASQAIVSDSARALKPAGRLIAPLGTSIPPALSELARDERRVIAEARGPLVQLSR